MTARAMWTGLAVVDTQGRVVVWRGSDTPKLFRSEEQGAHARTDGSELVPVTLILGRIMPAPEQPAAAAAAAMAAVMRGVRGAVRPGAYADKACEYRGCGEVFTPTGPRSIYCPRHTTARRA